MKDKIIFLLLIIFYRYDIDLIGEMSISALYIIVTSFWWFKHINLKGTLIRKIFILYVTLICIQLIIELLLGSEWINLTKGVAITVVSLFSFCFFYYKFYQHVDYVKLFLIGEIISLIIWPNILSDMEGSEFGYYKFTLVPLLSNFIILATTTHLLKKSEWIKNNFSLLVCYFGVFFMLTGARSSGVTIFFVGVIGLFLSYSSNITPKKIYKIILLGAFLGYAIYALFYVPQAMSGKLDKVGNSAQLKKADNPYNPISLLLVGRGDSFIPFLAFVDKPLTGYGYRAKDPNMKYHRLLFSLYDEKFYKLEIISSSIPAHSVVFGYAASYGIMGLILILSIVFIILHKGICSLVFTNRYLYVKIFFIYSIFWNFLFSPMTHMRLGLPIMLAFLLALYLREQKITMKYNIKNGTRYISNNSNVRQ